MKALITGVGGFVGKYLSELLIENNIDVCGVDRVKKSIKDVTSYEGDILDEESLFTIIDKEKPDLVFHLAGQSSVEKSFSEPELTKKINVLGTENVLKAVLKAKLKPKILVVSSVEVYGIPKTLPINEKHSLKPNSPYGESRVEQEKVCMQYVEDQDMHIIISRSFNHTGPGQPLPFVCPTITKQVAEIKQGKKKPVVMLGDPLVRRDFSDVRDMVKAYLVALEKGEKGEIYNLCSGKAHSLRELIDLLSKEFGIDITVEKDPTWNRKNDIPEIRGDHSKFTKDTYWQPEISFEKTLKDMVIWWEKESGN
jgi:GDP-4-dehydro-6-deoxy-D-mannose reductase